MKQYAIVTRDKLTGEITGCASSDAPFTVNPWGLMVDAYDFEEFEFDTNTETFIRGREVLNTLEVRGGAVAIKAANPDARIQAFSKVADEHRRFPKG